MQVWKFPISPDRPWIEMPKGAQLLSVATQRGYPCLWALVDPHAPKVKRKIETYGTGWDLPANPGKFVGTFLSPDGGSIVFHVFDQGE